MDILEATFSKIWPKRGGFWGPYLMLSPAILLVGLLVLGLAYIGDTSLRTLDTSTFLFSEEWSLANQRAHRAIHSICHLAKYSWCNYRYHDYIATGFPLYLHYGKNS